MTQQVSSEQASLGTRAANAAKWSVATQVIAKLIAPITTMLLARILTPEAFGIVATANMITSLADMVSDAGFQRFLIQHDFAGKDELSLSACVAFWTNLAFSVFLVLLIFVFQEPLAVVTGNPGMGMLLVVASFSVPLTSLVSVQTALYQRKLDFKTLFTSKVTSSLIILAVSVPLALLGLSYWSMVIGTIASNLFLAIWLTAVSEWKPKLRYSFGALKEMLSFGVWILGESVATWLNSWSGVFIIGLLLSATEVGYYKTTTAMCNQILTVITAAVLPVAYSSLAKVKSEPARFESVFLKMQGYLALCLVPLAAGMFVYRDLCVRVLFGSQWDAVALLFGLWMLISCFVVVFGYMCSEAYRAIGKPQYSVLVQTLYLIPYLPSLYFAALGGFERLSVTMPFVRLFLLVINLTVMKLTIGISPLKMLANIKWTYLQTILAFIPGAVLAALVPGLPATIAGVVLTVALYAALIWFTPATKQQLFELLERTGLIKTQVTDG